MRCNFFTLALCVVSVAIGAAALPEPVPGSELEARICNPSCTKRDALPEPIPEPICNPSCT
ncbi:hypothetical protein BD410DRAFT_789631 [Rickenella mellea]|uniref:Uncharacterized protein n=1 Tax=Rickenella mellea TaxID=50990 RepID=A0A4Y7Q2K8_9AGAM|nr:hypothetical protein BD410DRAFT_789631 [Rickenella mellea]